VEHARLPPHPSIIRQAQTWFATSTPGGKLIGFGNGTDGVWHLVTGTFSPSTGLALYVDGVLVGTNPAATAAQVFTGTWRLGADSAGGWPNSSGAWFTGRLAHASVTYRALTADEVAGEYLAGK
jgi:hypothetical protein